ncbi:MAG: 3-phosphoshikimate 1-carboxyvinyltransferase, partial [Emergencia sp.]
ESDRLATVSTVLQGLGAELEEGEDGRVIQGKGRLTGGHAEGFNDHRIVMMASVASLICEEEVILTGSHAVNKSYPDFFQVLEELGLNYRLERK